MCLKTLCITLPGFSSTYVSISTFDNVVEEVEFENETKIGQLILIYLIGGHLKKILLIENKPDLFSLCWASIWFPVLDALKQLVHLIRLMLQE